MSEYESVFRICVWIKIHVPNLFINSILYRKYATFFLSVWPNKTKISFLVYDSSKRSRLLKADKTNKVNNSFNTLKFKNPEYSEAASGGVL